jgi:hypothetical protein
MIWYAVYFICAMGAVALGLELHRRLTREKDDGRRNT